MRYVSRSDCADLVITAAGVDFVETHTPEHTLMQRLLQTGSRAEAPNTELRHYPVTAGAVIVYESRSVTVGSSEAARRAGIHAAAIAAIPIAKTTAT